MSTFLGVPNATFWGPFWGPEGVDRDRTFWTPVWHPRPPPDPGPDPVRTRVWGGGWRVCPGYPSGPSKGTLLLRVRRGGLRGCLGVLFQDPRFRPAGPQKSAQLFGVRKGRFEGVRQTLKRDPEMCQNFDQTLIKILTHFGVRFEGLADPEMWPREGVPVRRDLLQRGDPGGPGGSGTGVREPGSRVRLGSREAVRTPFSRFGQTGPTWDPD